MGASLKDALLKAGLKPKEFPNAKGTKGSTSNSNSSSSSSSSSRRSHSDKEVRVRPRSEQRPDFGGGGAQKAPRPSQSQQQETRSPAPAHTHTHSHSQSTEARSQENKPPRRSSNFCDSCKKTSSDVELYEHDIKCLTGKWLCCMCADKLKIPDTCRQTNQSEFARKRMFRREYGATKRFFS
ncbi:MAG: hypothetical protein HQK52_16725 [Oligoflexia bacterium]|nr:hypothetical protein [Oligoflexia bacterium]